MNLEYNYKHLVHIKNNNTDEISKGRYVFIFCMILFIKFSFETDNSILNSHIYCQASWCRYNAAVWYYLGYVSLIKLSLLIYFVSFYFVYILHLACQWSNSIHFCTLCIAIQEHNLICYWKYIHLMFIDLSYNSYVQLSSQYQKTQWYFVE